LASFFVTISRADRNPPFHLELDAIPFLSPLLRAKALTLLFSGFSLPFPNTDTNHSPSVLLRPDVRIAHSPPPLPSLFPSRSSRRRSFFSSNVSQIDDLIDFFPFSFKRHPRTAAAFLSFPSCAEIQWKPSPTKVFLPSRLHDTSPPPPPPSERDGCAHVA